MGDVQGWKEEKKPEEGDHKEEPEVARECGKREGGPQSTLGEFRDCMEGVVCYF